MRTVDFDFDQVKGRILLVCIFISLAVSLSPFKIIGYILPILLFFLVVLTLLSKNLHLRILALVAALLITIFFYFFKSNYFKYDFSLLPATISIITYGSILFALVYPRFVSQYDSSLTRKVQKLLYVIFLLETGVSLFQVLAFQVVNGFSLDAAAGDIVQGTINPLSFLNLNVGFNNQVFIINYIFLLIYLIPYFLDNKKRYLIATGIFVILVASVLHVVISLILALLLSLLLVGIIKFRKQLARFFLLGMLLISILVLTQPKNFSLFGYYYTNLSSGEAPKVLIIANSIALLPEQYPDALYVGLGPGQYTSRASLISSGRYFGDFENPTKLPFLSNSHTSKAFDDYVFDIWETYATGVEEYGNSTMSRPFFSIFTVIMEFGIVGFIAIIMLVFGSVFRIRKKCLQLYEGKQYAMSYFMFANMVSILFVVFLAFFENYLESSASICGGLLLVRYFNSIK